MSCPFLRFNGTYPSQTKPWATNEWQPQIPPASDANDPLVSINETFHTTYAVAGDRLRPTPLILLENDYMILWREPDRREVYATITPRLYHDLKMLCHVPLVVLTMLEAILVSINNPASSQPIPLTVQDHDMLRTLTAQLESLRCLPLNQRFPTLTEADIRLQHQLIEVTYAYVQHAAAGPTTRAELLQFAAEIQPALKRNVTLAAAAQVDELHAAVNRLQAELIPTDWNRLTVGLTAPTMARTRSLAALYFARRFGVDVRQNPKFFVMEEIDKEDHALRLIATHILDSQLSSALYGDPYYLWKDIMGDGASERIEQLFPTTVWEHCHDWLVQPYVQGVVVGATALSKRGVCRNNTDRSFLPTCWTDVNIQSARWQLVKVEKDLRRWWSSTGNSNNSDILYLELVMNEQEESLLLSRLTHDQHAAEIQEERQILTVMEQQILNQMEKLKAEEAALLAQLASEQASVQAATMSTAQGSAS